MLLVVCNVFLPSIYPWQFLMRITNFFLSWFVICPLIHTTTSFLGNNGISPITSHYQQAEVSDKDYICSLDKDNGMHRCSNFPPFKLSETISCHEAINPATFLYNSLSSHSNRNLQSSSFEYNNMYKTIPASSSITISFNDTFNSSHCINWNLYYTQCRPGMNEYLICHSNLSTQSLRPYLLLLSFFSVILMWK